MKGVDECPACGSAKTFILHARGMESHAACRECGSMWEPFDPAALCIADDPMSMFKQPCDNCAFRPGSVERSDPEEWKKLRAELRDGITSFWCHKGVPLSNEPDQSHDQPRLADGTPDIANMRECAGWVALRLAHMQAGVQEAANEQDG